MDYDYQILKLTKKFYDTHKAEQYPELLLKNSRSYNCLFIDLYDDYYICVPYRTDIRHKNAYKFTHSRRSRQHQSGLDYTKIVIAKDSAFLGTESSVIDDDEYKETVENMERIVSEVIKFINAYLMHHTGVQKLNPKQYERKYKYSSLQYFHKELGITDSDFGDVTP